jgi:tetratricopeptide (TPR) repeat protein
LIIAIYLQVGNYGFILYDDEDYILLHSRLRLGFTFENIQWFLTSSYASNWHPITWFSHILDVKLFGLNAMGHHYVSVAIHGTNSILIFLFLHRFTGSAWRSATVAALFAVHPLNVESVAWVSERKNVLSTMFWILTLYFYAMFTVHKNKKLYFMTVLVFILGLMSKQMLVSIPIILLLLDFWPLRRMSLDSNVTLSGSPNTPVLKPLLLEKVPFLLLAVFASIIAFISQQNAINSLHGYSLYRRLANAFTSYIQYIRKICWPDDLAVFYPFPESIHLWATIASVVILIAITNAAWRLRVRYPALLVGWFWYLITLLPVIGIVKIGFQAMADRYAYIPAIGIFIMTVWTIADITRNLPRRKLILSCFAVACIMTFSVTAWWQTSYWKSTRILFTHALTVTKVNYVAVSAIGRALENEGKLDEALRIFDEAIKLAPPSDNWALIHQGIMLMNGGMLDAAAGKFKESIFRNSATAPGYINLGMVLALQGRLEEAVSYFKIALNIEPRSAAANYNLALILKKLGKNDEAISHYLLTLATDPTDHECHYNLGIVLEKQGRYEEAIRHYSEALLLKPEFQYARNSLNAVLQKQKNTLRP